MNLPTSPMKIQPLGKTGATVTHCIGKHSVLTSCRGVRVMVRVMVMVRHWDSLDAHNLQACGVTVKVPGYH
jgi:hypothetical protein